LDRLLTETTSLGTVTYTYDTAGRRTSMTVSGQSPVSYTYDATARLRTITQAPLNPVDLQYDAANRRTLLTLPNGVSTEYQYDEASRLVALIYRNALGPLGDLTYGYDAGGNRIATGGSFARTLVPEAVTTATYDAGNRQLAFGSNTQTFDDNGNLLTRTDGSGTTTYTWDARNRLTGLTGSSLAASFAYDGLGRRAQKTVNSVLTQFRYDGLDAVGESTGGSDVHYLRTSSIDEALVRTDNVDSAHYVADALGSSVALATAGGTLTTTYSYEPFGRTEVTGTPTPNPFRFTGREDDSIGLYYYRARYYDPGRGRFVSQDPIGLAGGGALLPNIPSGARDGRRPSCDDPRSPRLHHNPDLRCRFPPPHPDRSPRPDHAVRV
jgi:RHS repeat-associated protein